MREDNDLREPLYGFSIGNDCGVTKRDRNHVFRRRGPGANDPSTLAICTLICLESALIAHGSAAGARPAALGAEERIAIGVLAVLFGDHARHHHAGDVGLSVDELL